MKPPGQRLQLSSVSKPVAAENRPTGQPRHKSTMKAPICRSTNKNKKDGGLRSGGYTVLLHLPEAQSIHEVDACPDQVPAGQATQPVRLSLLYVPARGHAHSRMCCVRRLHTHMPSFVHTSEALFRARRRSGLVAVVSSCTTTESLSSIESMFLYVPGHRLQ